MSGETDTGGILCAVCSDKSCSRHSSGGDTVLILLPSVVNSSIEDFLETLLDDYVNSWYTDVSSDECFVQQLRCGLRQLAAFLTERVTRVDLSDLIWKKLFPAGIEHVNSFLSANGGNVGTDPEAAERYLAYMGDNLHEALLSRESELEYLKNIADYVIESALPQELTSSQPTTIFLREILTFSVLLPIMDVLADPDILNKLLLLALDPEPFIFFTDPPSKKVPVLDNWVPPPSPFKNVSDSLLQVKLSDILEDRELLYYFMHFIRDVPIAVRYLAFIKAVYDLQKCLNSSLDQCEDVQQLRYEAWRIYCDYFHESGRDVIQFPVEIFEGFRDAVEKKGCDNLDLIEKELNAAYQFVYDQVQSEYVGQFCQSPVFFKMVAGVREPPELPNKDAHSVEEGWLVFNKVRSRLSDMFVPQVADGSVPIRKTSYLEVGDEIVVEDGTHHEYPSQDSLSPDFSSPGERTSFCMDPTMEPFDENYEFDGGFGDLDIVNENPSNISAMSPTVNLDVAPQSLKGLLVSIPQIEPRRDRQTQKMIYVYIVEVQHQGLLWTVERRYGQFYVLENKLNEFHGNSITFPPLPPKKSFGSKARAFLESMRPLFDEFLRTLLIENDLACSQLILSFLTPQAEFTSSILPDINPLRAIKAVPSRMVRERGQNLHSFVSVFAKNTAVYELSCAPLEAGAPILSKKRVTDMIFGTIFENNADVRTWVASVEKRCGMLVQPQSQLKGSVLLPHDQVLYILACVFQVSGWVFNLLCSFRLFCRDTFNSWILQFSRLWLSKYLHERQVAKLIDELRFLVFVDDAPPRSDSEKRERYAEVLRQAAATPIPAILERLLLGRKKWSAGSASIVNCLQHPRPNKQLSYCLFDSLLRELFFDGS